MGFIFALFFSIILLFISMLLFVIGVVIRKRSKVITFLLYVFSILTMIPVLALGLIVTAGYFGSKSLENDSEKKSGKLITAIVYRHPEKAITLINHGYDLSRKTIDTGNTALHAACMIDNKKIVELLIANKIDINSQNNNRETALLCCIHYMDNEMLGILLKNGAEINSVNDNGENPILKVIKFIEFGEQHYDKIKLLLEYKCDKDIKDINDKTANDYLEDKISEYESINEDYLKDEKYQELLKIKELLNNSSLE
jgi:hypothetical protein